MAKRRHDESFLSGILSQYGNKSVDLDTLEAVSNVTISIFMDLLRAEAENELDRVGEPGLTEFDRGRHYGKWEALHRVRDEFTGFAEAVAAAYRQFRSSE